MKRLYVLVSKKLTPVYGCVQGGHAVAQFLLENEGKQDWNNSYLIYLYADVEQWKKRLTRCGIKFSEFKEPDLNDQLTAIACQDDSGELFKNLNLVK
jgi:hypothetical protein